MLFEAEAPGVLPVREEDPAPRTLVPGVVRARLVGGNLSMLASLCGTRDALRARGRILFLEDVGEPAYRVDRMLAQLRRSGALEGVAGLALGRFTEAGTDRTAEESTSAGGETASPDAHPVADVLKELAGDLGVPAVTDLPFGHVEHNCTLPVGGQAVLDAEEAILALTEAAVEMGV